MTASFRPRALLESAFLGTGFPLCDGDIERAAAELGCEAAVVRAVLAVEAAGGGFLPDRRPKILFEAHVFSRLTRRRFDRTHPAISSPKWNRALYAGGAGEYARLLEAVALDRPAALKAASWGLFQILGENHAEAGFGDVEAFVAAHLEGEGAHLAAFVSFVRSVGLDDELRGRQWAEFARGYNGPGYAANRYDVKLAAAFAKALRDCVARPLGGAELQAALNAHGARLTVDGMVGPKTLAALRAFQTSRGLPTTGQIDRTTRRALGFA